MREFVEQNWSFILGVDALSAAVVFVLLYRLFSQLTGTIKSQRARIIGQVDGRTVSEVERSFLDEHFGKNGAVRIRSIEVSGEFDGRPFKVLLPRLDRSDGIEPVYPDKMTGVVRTLAAMCVVFFSINKKQDQQLSIALMALVVTVSLSFLAMARAR